MVTNEPVPRPSTTFLASSQAKHFFFSTNWKYRRLPIWLKILNPEKICCIISISKRLVRGTLSIVRTGKTRRSQTQEIKTFSAKNECNGVNYGVITKFKFRYSILKYLLVWFNQLTGLHPLLIFKYPKLFEKLFHFISYFNSFSQAWLFDLQLWFYFSFYI